MQRKLLLATLAGLRVHNFVIMIWSTTAVIAASILRVMAADGDLDATMRVRCPAYFAWLKAHPSVASAPLEPIPPDLPPGDPLLRADLLQMAKADQDARARIHPRPGLNERAVRDVYLVDANNLA